MCPLASLCLFGDGRGGEGGESEKKVAALRLREKRNLRPEFSQAMTTRGGCGRGRGQVWGWDDAIEQNTQ
jgi:hypothetical protein